MNERDMVLDTLSSVKASLANYAKMIVETGDEKLRQTYMEMRDGDETFQRQMYQVASDKGYYVQPPSSDMLQQDQIKSELLSFA